GSARFLTAQRTLVRNDNQTPPDVEARGEVSLMKLRMRTKFLLSRLLVSAGLTWTSLLLVRRTVQAQVKKSIFADLHNSVRTYQNFYHERELTLTHLAELLADLPNLRALMTTQHEAT